MSIKQELKRLVDECIEKGWNVQMTAKGHFKFLAPNNAGVFFCAGTPSDYRAIKNTKARIRQAEQGRLVQ